MKIRQILAQNIKRRRKSLGISQERLAELTDLSAQTINTIECCRMWVSDKSITRLAKALETEIFQLLIPFQLKDDEIRDSSSIVLLELRQKIKNDIDAFNLQLETNFKEALESPIRESKEEQATQKPKRAR